MSIPSRAALQSESPPPPPASSPAPQSPEEILAELGLITLDGDEPILDPDVLADERAAELALAGAEPAPVEAPAPAPETPKPVETPAASATDPKLEALIERESRVVDQMQTIKEFQPKLDEIQRRLDEYETAKAQYKLDRVAYLRTLDPDLDPDDLAKELWYEKLGSAAPLEYRVKKDVRAAHKESHQTRAEFEALQKRTAEENARKQAEASEAQYVDSLRGYLSSVPSELALVQHLSKSKPDVAVRMLRDAARMIAPGLGRNPTTEEAAKAVQQYLDEIGYVAPAPTPATPAQSQASAPATPPTTTIRNSHSTVQPSRIPPDENDPRVLRRNGLRAMAEAVGDPRLADLPVDW